MNPLLIFGSILGPIWLFQLRANAISLAGQGPWVPDLLALGTAMAMLRLSPRQAMAYAFIAGLVTDISGDWRFGAVALRDTLLVAALLPLRRALYFQSRSSVFGIVLIFGLLQQLVTGLIFMPELATIWWWLPKSLLASFSLASAALILEPGFAAVMPFAEDEAGPRGFTRGFR